MTPEDIVRMVETDMKEGGIAYQPAYWQTKLLIRIQCLVENELAKLVKGHQCQVTKNMGIGPTGT